MDKPSKPIHGPAKPIHGPPPPQLVGPPGFGCPPPEEEDERAPPGSRLSSRTPPRRRKEGDRVAPARIRPPATGTVLSASRRARLEGGTPPPEGPTSELEGASPPHRSTPPATGTVLSTPHRARSGGRGAATGGTRVGVGGSR
ncbi:pollen-specific leucine-rich repeat extensin-like protein 3 [Sorghum bicolor]|uniref:pollen-specific leucine-rich repeat extensin-like protein 3 n=1 Tax=Sorghum bicolor TaxID=4558 RepID=UPI000B4269F6|nr:pollen-specific leucine-rich repeat extensin-like protein 3 [Sorghum bicolor]|eukprot:XP_021303743.1 pollen-specific leucine-rich repeat extensin-like protein 3 [Sorghum bicolor]